MASGRVSALSEFGIELSEKAKEVLCKIGDPQFVAKISDGLAFSVPSSYQKSIVAAAKRISQHLQ